MNKYEIKNECLVDTRFFIVELFCRQKVFHQLCIVFVAVGGLMLFKWNNLVKLYLFTYFFSFNVNAAPLPVYQNIFNSVDQAQLTEQLK